MMKRRIFTRLVAVLLLSVSVAWGEVVEKARRVAGVAEIRAELMDDDEKWDPLSEEARKYIGPMESGPSARFRVGYEMPQSIGSEEDLWRTLNAMHRELQEKRVIHLADGVSMADLHQWIRLYNNQITTYAYCGIDKKKRLWLLVYYHTESRVLAAFFNPELRKKLRNEEEKVLRGCANWISANILWGMPNLLKIRMVNDAIIDNTEYQLSCGKTADVVLRGKGKCAAYTTATQLLLHMLGIDNRYVYGDVTTSTMSHAWNLVDVNGEWYHMDTTWNDPAGYHYFLLNDEEMGIDHSWPSKEADKSLIYPEGPELNEMHFFTRNDYTDREEQEKEPRLFPVDEDSSLPKGLLKSIQAGFQHEISVVTDEKVNPVGKLVPEPTRILDRRKKNEAEPDKLGNAYTVASVEDLDKILKHCATSLEGPRIRLKLTENQTLDTFRTWLKKCAIHSYIRSYSYTSSEKKPFDKEPIITLTVEYWPHLRLIQAAQNDEAMKRLTPAERTALTECRSIADICGTVWKLRRQKIDDAYLRVLERLEWKPGESTVVSAMEKQESGSLGMAETLQVVYALMKVPSQLVHGRTHEKLQAWNKVQHTGDRWYHADAAMDAEADIVHRFKIKWNHRSDMKMSKTHVWPLHETKASPPDVDTDAIKEAVEKKTKRKLPELPR